MSITRPAILAAHRSAGSEAPAAPHSSTTPHTSLTTQFPAARSTQWNQDRKNNDQLTPLRRRRHRNRAGVPRPLRLAGERQREPGVFARWPDLELGGQDRRQLLARTRLHPRDRRAAPRGRLPHPRPRHVRRILRGLVPQAPHPGGLQRRGRRDRLGPAAPLLLGVRPDRQLPRHPPKRVGGRPGVLLLRHLHGALRAPGRHGVRGRRAVHAGAHLQPERALALGKSVPLHEPHLRLDVPGRPGRRAPPHRRRGRRLHLRRAPAGNGPHQPRVHRGHDGRRRGRASLHVPDPDLQHHARLRLGGRKCRRALRHDREVRPALLPELHQLRPGPAHDPLDVLPPPAGPA